MKPLPGCQAGQEGDIPRDRASAWSTYASDEVKLDRLEALIDDALRRDSDPVVLEAGCGSASWFQFPRRCTVVGIDVSQEQLDRNDRLSRKILGDVETFDFSTLPSTAVICAFVLEHLNDPSRAIANLAKALRPGGVMVLIAPNPFSAVGLFTKLSPHWFHVWFYRSALGNPNAGKPGYAPFRAPMRLAMAPGAIARSAGTYGLEVTYQGAWLDHLSWIASRRSRMARFAIRAARATSRALSLGRWDLSKGTYAIVLRRPGA